MIIPQTTIKTPMEELKEAFDRAGLLMPSSIVFDGKIHRYHADAEKGKCSDAGWYWFSDEENPYGAFGSWASTETVKFSYSGISIMSESDRSARNERIARAMEEAEEERIRSQEEASRESSEFWKRLHEATTDNFYIKKKQLHGTYGARANGKDLVLPLMDMDGRICSLQTINEEKGKRYWTNGKTKGCFWMIGEGDPVYMAEGFATAASVYEATGKPCIVAFSAGNLKPVHDLFPKTKIIADNDESGTGEAKAKLATDNYIVIPSVGMDANDYAVANGLDALRSVIEKEPSLKLIPGRDVLSQPKPRRWLVRNMIPQGPAFTMTFGASGNGKTFVLVDRMLSVATGQTECEGQKVTKGKVLYLCGEGTLAVRARIAAWCQYHRIRPESLDGWFFMTEEAVHLDTPEGYNKLIETLEYNCLRPDWIVADTLNRHMSGDENDTQDASAFISACSELSNLFSATLTTVHHTGLAEGAQKRARGSSAFRGALDMQDMVTKNGETVTISQTKNKGGKELEPVYMDLVDVPITGWFDDDGNQIECGVLKPSEGEHVVEEKTRQQITDENMIIDAFIQCDAVFYKGKPYLPYSTLQSWIANGKEGDDEAKNRASAAKDLQINQGSAARPRLMARLIKYGDIEPHVGGDGKTIGFWCNEINQDGLVLPHFVMSTRRGEDD